MSLDRRRNVIRLSAAATAALCLSSVCCARGSPAAAWVVGGVPTSVLLQQRARPQMHPISNHPARRFNPKVAATSEATPSTTTIPAASTDVRRPSSTAIVGGGPAGLAVALMLARRGYRNITVLERLKEPPPPASEEWGNPERSYNLGIGARGQTSLAKLGAAERVLSWCADAVVSAPPRALAVRSPNCKLPGVERMLTYSPSTLGIWYQVRGIIPCTCTRYQVRSEPVRPSTEYLRVWYRGYDVLYFTQQQSTGVDLQTVQWGPGGETRELGLILCAFISYFYYVVSCILGRNSTVLAFLVNCQAPGRPRFLCWVVCDYFCFLRRCFLSCCLF